MSRSGGMTTEISSSLTAAGLGVSTAVSIGGDAIIGSTYAELMPLFEADEQTEAIVIYTEPGGRMEAELVDWREANDSRLPIVAFMAGKFMDDEEMQGMSFGHAGTIVEGKEDSATEKIARLEAAGIPVVERIDEIPDVVKEKLGRLMADQHGTFIEVEVSDEVATTPSSRRSSRRSAPSTSSSRAERRRRDRPREPRRVRALRALPRRGPAGQRRRQEALRRHRAEAVGMAVADNPLRAAMEARDLALLDPALSPNVVLRSPVISTPFSGRDELLDLFAVLFEALGPLTYETDIPGDPHVFTWKTEIGGEPLEGVDLVRYDEAGLIREITVFMRPLRGIAAFLDATGPALARRRGGAGRAALMRVLGPPPSLVMKSVAGLAPRILRLGSSAKHD